MNRVIARSIIALFLLLTALLLTLTCTAVAETYTYNEYSWDESKGELKTNVVTKTRSETDTARNREYYQCYLSGDNRFYCVDIMTEDLDYFDSTNAHINTINIESNKTVSLLLLRNVRPADTTIEARIAVNLGENSTLNIYSLSTKSRDLSKVDFILGAGSTLNLHCNVVDGVFQCNGDSPLPTVNLYQPLSNFGFQEGVNFLNLKNIIFNVYESIGLGQLLLHNTTLNLHNDISLHSSSTNTNLTLQNNSTLNFYSGKIVFHGDKNIDVEIGSTLNLCPSRKNEYICVFNGYESTPTSGNLIGAYRGENPKGLFDILNVADNRTMWSWTMTEIVLDEESATHTVYLDELPSFTYTFKTTPELNGFTVQYRKSGGDSDWITDMPTAPGTYDVKITRPIDLTYLPFDQVISGGLVITKHSQAAPTGVAAVAETLRHKNDGRLTGVTTAMEYRANDSSDYTAVTGTEVANLAPGTYFVRFKETATHFASADVQLTVASGRAAYDTDSTQGVKGISADNVQPENEALLRQALSDYQNALDTLGNRFTEAEKQEVQAAMDRIRSALASLERAAAVRKAITALPGAVEPDDTDAEASIRAAKTAYDALTAHEKALVGDAPAAKLDSLLPMLTAYRIIYGDGASIIAGQNTALSFTANGPLSKLTAVLVDGKTLDAKHYTAQSGSTIITLAADYVRTLAVGEHTLTVRYTDGETSAHFTVTAMPKDIPQTGDTSRPAAWLALLSACCAGLWLVNRRRG